MTSASDPDEIRREIGLEPITSSFHRAAALRARPTRRSTILLGVTFLRERVNVEAQVRLRPLDLPTDLIGVARTGHGVPPRRPFRASGTLLRVSTVRSGLGCTWRSFARPVV